MIKLLKNMRRKEKLMALLCLLFVVVQVYFDLRPPDYMSELTVLIKISGTTADIVNVGLKMLGCTAISAVLAIACGFLAAKTAAGFSFAVRDKLFHHVMDIGSEEMQDFSIPSLITRTTNDINDLKGAFVKGNRKCLFFSKQCRPTRIIRTVNFQRRHLCRPTFISAIAAEAVPVVVINLLYCFFAHPSVLVFFPKA